MSDITECPKCKGTNFTLKSVYHGDKFMYRVLECKDCNKAALDKMISELSPTKGLRYSKTKLRTEYYGTVTIKDIIDDET